MASMFQGLLGGGIQPPPGLLGKYYNPADDRRNRISQGLMGFGIGLLRNGKGSFGEVLGNGLAGGLQQAQQAGDDYFNSSFKYAQIAQQQKEIEEKEAEKKRLMDWVSSRSPEEQEWLSLNPEAGAKMWQEQKFKQMYPEPGEGFTLGEGQQRFDATGRPIASVPQGPPKLTADQQDFAAGLADPRFRQYEIDRTKAGAQSININGSDGNFDKELSKGVAGVYVQAMEAGQNAMSTKTAAQQLRVLMNERGGVLDGLGAAASPYLPEGVVPEGANDIVAAQAIIAGLVPKQRVPGSGTTSDFDAKKFSQSLPSIWNKPGGNEIILNTMESYADYQIAVSNVVADVASDPSVTNKAAEIRRRILEVPDPFIAWKQYMASSAAKSGADPALKKKYGLE